LALLARERAVHLGLAHAQRQPRQIPGVELMAFWRNQAIPAHVEILPVRPQVLAAPQDPHELEGRVGDAHLAGLPVAQRAHADPQQRGALAQRQAQLMAGIAKGPGMVQALQLLPVAMPDLGVWNFA
jgi:hypothetical protein